MEKIRILYIIYNIGLGGQEKRLFELLKNIDRNEIEYNVLSLSRNIEREVYFKSYNIPFYACQNSNKYFRLKKVFQKCKDFKPEIIHSFDPISNVYVGIANKFFRKKAIGQFNACFMQSKILGLFNRIFANSFEKIICNSYAGFDYFKNICKIPEKKLIVIENGFDFEIMENPPFKISSLKEILRKEITGPVVGLVGKLDENKDPMTFVKAAEIVHKHFPDVLFCIIGDGIYKDMVENYLIKNKMKDYFYLIPKRIDAPWLIKDFTVGVLSSKNEGFPNVLLEYMYWEKPCVVTDAGDSGRIVVDGETGFVVEKGDFISFANSIITLLSSREKLCLMGKKGREKLENKYKIDRNVKEFYLLYKELLKYEQ